MFTQNFHSSSEAIAKSEIASLNAIFEDEKVSRQIIGAAKRLHKKRTATSVRDPPSAKKSRKPSDDGGIDSPSNFEASLELSACDANEGTLSRIVLYTNRAPLVLAFAVTLLKYTMPNQPLSSRLSLAQALVSANSRTKAVNIGLESGKSAEEEGWGQRNPSVKVMGREIRVMKRWAYEWKPDESTKTEIKEENKEEANEENSHREPALWGLDLEALKKTKKTTSAGSAPGTNMPIYAPQPARAYLLKSFHRVKETDEGSSVASKKTSALAKAAEKEKNLGMLLQALDLLHQSWASVLSTEELDRRSWSWYVKVRPDVEYGVAGWGGKGEVKLSDILDLRRS